MKQCPICRVAPWFHYASNITSKHNRDVENRNKWTRYFLWCGQCKHSDAFGVALGVIPESQQAEIEQRWDARAEELFVEYTRTVPWSEERIALWHKQHPGDPVPASSKGWTDIQRTGYRATLWPPPPAPIELFDRHRNEAPTI